MDKTAFLRKYRISDKEFQESGCDWKELLRIRDDFESLAPDLRLAANYIAERLREIPHVHSVKMRIKNSEHLLAKVFRKADNWRDDPVNVDNYRQRITDLIGLRAIHLFKEDWFSIDDRICAIWELVEEPCANVRSGDPDIRIEEFRRKGCRIHEHPFGYRSVHYLVKSKPEKQTLTAEIQVRTIFEEGWSEIDHRLRYPNNQDDVLVGQLLAILNRLAGSADEMGSFVCLLRNEMHEVKEVARVRIQEKNNTITELTKKIQQLEIAQAEKDSLTKRISALSEELYPPASSVNPFSSNLSTAIAGYPKASYLTASGMLNPKSAFGAGSALDALTVLQGAGLSQGLGIPNPGNPASILGLGSTQTLDRSEDDKPKDDGSP